MNEGSARTMSVRIARLAQRAGWGVADQALSSLTNFILGVFVARMVSPEEFGAFSLAFATYLFVLNASRGMATDPLAIRFSDVSAATWRRGVAASTATATTFGVVAGALCVLVALVPNGVVGLSFLSLGLMMPGLMLQDSWRYAFFAAGQGSKAFINDLAWGVFLALLMALALAVENPRVHWFVLAWGGAATLAAFVGMVQARVVPRVSALKHWYRAHHDLGVRYLTENVGYSAAGQLRFYGLGAISGLAAVGALRGAELLLGPINLVIMGIGGLMAIPEAARLARRALHRLRPFCVFIALMFFLTSILWAAAIHGLIGDVFGERLLGETWESAAALLLPATMIIAFQGVWCAAWIGLRALGAARRSLQAQAFGASVFLVAALLGAYLNDGAGAAWGCAVGNFLAACIWWRHLHHGIEEFRVATAVPRLDAPVPSA
jgi:O-antigen/teichoic acid export membrane protein